MATIKVDQEKFEARTAKKVFTRYLKSFYLESHDWEVVRDMDGLTCLPESLRFGCYKHGSAMNLGAMLNGLKKSAIGTQLSKFLTRFSDDRWAFIINLSSSTADYVLISRNEGEDMLDSLNEATRFVSFMPFGNSYVALTRLDDYLNYKWPQMKDEI